MDDQMPIHWIRENMPRTARAVARLRDLSGTRIACSIHIEPKMIPYLEGLQSKGAEVSVTSCSADTVRDEVVKWLNDQGIATDARRGMSSEELRKSRDNIMDWNPTHLVEVGGDLSVGFHQGLCSTLPKASLECTASGLSATSNLHLKYPVFDLDSIPVKEGLHNRFMVGLSTWTAFFFRTQLSLHEKTVAVLGYGMVGQGVAEAAKSFGAQVIVVEPNASRAVQARYAGYRVLPMLEALAEVDVVVTATGRSGILGAKQLSLLKNGTILVNVGHSSDEIDRSALTPAHSSPIEFINEYFLDEKRLFLFADGSIANLVAGLGDSINTFDMTLALLVAATGYCVDSSSLPPGLHPIPEDVWTTAV